MRTKQNKTEIERFLNLVTKTDSCWFWRKTSDRYSRFRKDNGDLVLGHRFAYEYYVGPIPEGLQIDHICNNKKCVNPKHLQPVTNRENVILAYKRRRTKN